MHLVILMKIQKRSAVLMDVMVCRGEMGEMDLQVLQVSQDQLDPAVLMDPGDLREYEERKVI